jgi:hypothetical protein
MVDQDGQHGLLGAGSRGCLGPSRPSIAQPDHYPPDLHGTFGLGGVRARSSWCPPAGSRRRVARSAPTGRRSRLERACGAPAAFSGARRLSPRTSGRASSPGCDRAARINGTHGASCRLGSPCLDLLPPEHEPGDPFQLPAPCLVFRRSQRMLTPRRLDEAKAIEQREQHGRGRRGIVPSGSGHAASVFLPGGGGHVRFKERCCTRMKTRCAEPRAHSRPWTPLRRPRPVRG